MSSLQHLSATVYARKIARSYTCDLVQTELKDKLGRIAELKQLSTVTPALESSSICTARVSGPPFLGTFVKEVTR